MPNRCEHGLFRTSGGGSDGSGVKVGDQTESQNTEAERCGRGHVCQRLGMTGESDSFF
jgi:hypothetical protein